MKTKVSLYKTPLAVATHKGKIFLFSHIKEVGAHPHNIHSSHVSDQSKIVYNTSSDGINFSSVNTPVSIVKGKQKVHPDTILSFKIFSPQAADKEYCMTLDLASPLGVQVLNAFSTDLKVWHVSPGVLPVPFSKQTFFLKKTKGQPQTVLYYADREIWTQLKKRTFEPAHILINPRLDSFDSQPLEILVSIPEKEGLCLIYSSQAFAGNSVDMNIGAVMCSYKEPSKVLWRSNAPLWNGYFDKSEYLIPVGGGKIKNNIFVYWVDIKGDLIIVKLEKNDHGFSGGQKIIKASGPLKRVSHNPVLEPRHGYTWEADGTFNPGAYMDDSGIVHLLYRAIGSDGISRIGYAHSSDGVHFARRSSTPVFEPTPGFGLPHAPYHNMPMQYNPLFYTSGGSWGGSEDPRIVRIEGRVYMMYVAFEGWNSVRIAMTSILEKDLQHENWKWNKPVYISAPGEINKNWGLFPEKIKGKYAIVTSIAPRVSVSYIERLDQLDGTRVIHSDRPQGPQPGRLGFWDSLLRGAGPPPLKTKDGWLLLYHALDKRDSSRYKLGAMILDKKDPQKVLYRASNPLLSPDMHYENEGKPGVVYASGAVIKNNILHIYYGGGDRVVCVAKAPIDEFLDYIKNGKPPVLDYTRINVN